MPTVHLVHGYIGAGKTTFARKLEAELPAVRFSADEWMVVLYGHNPPVEHFAKYFARVEELIWKTSLDVLENGCDVVIDAAFWTRESRDSARKRLKKIGLPAKFYAVTCSEKLMRERAIQRTGTLPPDSFWINEEAFDTLKNKFQPMQEDEDYISVDGATGGLL